MIQASVDIGTNTVLMTVKNMETGEILGDFHNMARMGENLHHTGIIGEPALGRLIKILLEYKETGKKIGVDKFSLIATSAMRDAKNRQHIIDSVKAVTGFEIEVISGDQEAELTFHGGLDGLQVHSDQFGLIDIGGGSTEYILGNKQAIFLKKSLNIGTVRLSERFHLQGEDPSKFQISQFQMHVSEQLNSLPFQKSTETTWIAVAGTPTSLSAILNGLKTYQPEVVHGSILPADFVSEKRKEFQSIPSSEIRNRYPILGKRYDLMLAGCLILESSMTFFGIKSLVVSDRGLRYGIFTSKQG